MTSPQCVGRHGGVRWSLAEARELASGGRACSARRWATSCAAGTGHVPLLRLPLPAEGTAPEGYDTAVVLPLRDGAAHDLAERLLAAVDDALLLTLPGLAEVVVETPEAAYGTLTRAARTDRTSQIEARAAGATGAGAWRVATAAASPARSCSPTGPSRSGCAPCGR